MIRRLVLGEAANEEVREVGERPQQRSPEQRDEFLSAVRVGLRAIREFPFAKAVRRRTGTMEIRLFKLERFPYILSYFVYPSVDSQTGEALDVIYVLACRHEKQAEPNWGALAPFRGS